MTSSGAKQHVRRTSAGTEFQTNNYANAVGHNITVIGVSHVAHATFWCALQSDLDAVAGHGVVHVERVRPAERPTTAEEDRAISVIKRLVGMQKPMAAILGLSHQSDALTVRNDWQNHDLTLVHLCRGLTPDAVRRLRRGMPVIPEGRVPAIISRFFLWALSGSRSAELAMRLASIGDKTLDPAVVLDERNEYAIGKAVAEPRDVTLVWGAAHTPGMDTLLRAAGYTRLSSSWRLGIPRAHRPPKGYVHTAAAVPRTDLA